MHVIGIDAGGTNTVCLLADERRVVIAASRAGGANLQTYGEQEVENVLRRVIGGVVAGRDVRPDAICVGIAGVDRESDAEVVRRAVGRLGVGSPVVVVNDALVALTAGVGDGPGVVLVAGTGSIAYGRNSAGLAARAGGWGPVLGDEGGGLWIGRAALSAIVRHADGRGPATVLTDRLLQHLGLASSGELIHEVHARDLRSMATAEVARLVQEAADTGDRIAADILDRASAELAVSAGAVFERLGLREEACPTILSGGVFRHIPRVVDGVVSRLSTVAPRSHVRVLDIEPALGAVHLALLAARGSFSVPLYV